MNAHCLLGKILSLIKTISVSKFFLWQELVIFKRPNSSPLLSCRDLGDLLSFCLLKDDFINADLPKANTFGLDILMERTVLANIPHSLVLATFGKKDRLNVIFKSYRCLIVYLIQIFSLLLNCGFRLWYNGIPTFLVKAVSQNEGHANISLCIWPSAPHLTALKSFFIGGRSINRFFFPETEIKYSKAIFWNSAFYEWIAERKHTNMCELSVPGICWLSPAFWRPGVSRR